MSELVWSVHQSSPGPVNYPGPLKHSRDEGSREEKMLLITTNKIWRGELRGGTGANVLSSGQVRLGEQVWCSSPTDFNFPSAYPSQIETCRIIIFPYLAFSFWGRRVRQMSINSSSCKIKNMIPGFQGTGWPLGNRARTCWHLKKWILKSFLFLQAALWDIIPHFPLVACQLNHLSAPETARIPSAGLHRTHCIACLHGLRQKRQDLKIPSLTLAEEDLKMQVIET